MDTEDELVITNKGFQFLLQDTHVQVWSFLIQYIQLAPVYPFSTQFDDNYLSFFCKKGNGNQSM